MQWILQEFEDTNKLALTLEGLGIPHTKHKVVPFVGELLPDPTIEDRSNVILFGSYTLWRYAEKHALTPGVFRIRPFLDEASWQDFMLNGPEVKRLKLHEIPAALANETHAFFIRPIEDSKEIAGKVLNCPEIVELAQKVLAIPQKDLPKGSLRHDTEMMLSAPARIHKEWRIWVVADRITTYSLYMEGRRVIYRPEIDADAIEFAQHLIAANPNYASAYVMDICRTADGLRLLETNCINAAGFYAADIQNLVLAIEALSAVD